MLCRSYWNTKQSMYGLFLLTNGTLWAVWTAFWTNF